MDQSIVIAIVSAAGAVIVGVSGLVANVVWMGKTFEQLDKRITERLAKIESKTEQLDTSIRMLIGSNHDLDRRISIIEDRLTKR